MVLENEKPWYALYVPNGKEDTTKASLEKHFDTIAFTVLKRRLKERKDGQWHMKERKLFPGYVLVNGDIDAGMQHDMRAKHPECKLLKSDNELLRVTPKELEVLGLLTKESDGMIGLSSLYKENDEIKVIDGALVGLEGLIISVNPRKGRAKVSLDFIGGKRVVELGVELVEKVS